MSSIPLQDRSTMIVSNGETFADSFAGDVERGLNDSPKHLPCKYFYDYAGSLLFEAICQLQEYYLTRAETEILETYSEEIIACLPTDIALVELGSGSSIKTCVIIEELLNQYDKVSYSPIDISKRMLRESSLSLLQKYENLEIVSVAAEYHEGLRRLTMHHEKAKLVLWLGSSIGNFDLGEAARFLGTVVETLSPEDYFLIGFDLVKDKNILEKAYNDAQGVTAEFNRNLLRRINRELGGEFDPDTFRHQATYNEEKNRIEMYLTSDREQDVHIADIGRPFHFRGDERIHTENSHKFTTAAIGHMAEQVGFQIIKLWFDSRRYFNLTLFKPDKR